MSFIYFIIMVGILVFVHELGHFLVAKAVDVKVLRFSVGVGPRVLGFVRGETEYVLCALPLGGYVQMLGGDFSDLEALPDEEDMSRALMAKPVWQRSLVVLAGPLFNLVLPVIIYFIVGLGQTTAAPAIVGEVFVDSPAARAGLQSGDVLKAINDEPVKYWHDLLESVRDAYDQDLKIDFTRDGKARSVTLRPEKKTSTDFLGLNVQTYGQVGIHSGTYGPTLAVTDPESVAAKAGLRSGDRVATVNGAHVERFDQLEALVRQSDGKPLKLVVVRPRTLPADYGSFYDIDTLRMSVTPVKGADGVYTLGAVRAEMIISRLEPGTAAARAGLKIGDRVLSVDGKRYESWYVMVRHIHERINKLLLARTKDDTSPVVVDFKLKVQRGGQEITTTLTPQVKKFADQAKQDRYKITIGWGHTGHLVLPKPVEFPVGERIVWSAKQSVAQTGEYIKMMVMGFVRMGQGKIGCDSLGGPILIGELAAKAGEAGLGPFVKMMAIISINLAIFNMVPIPVLDGGQLLLFWMEAIKRGPLSFRTRQIASYVGFVMIVLVMLLAFKNDIERNWDRVVDWIGAGP